MKKIYLIILAFFMGLGVVGCGPDNTPEAVAKEAVERLYDGDYSSAIDLVYTEAYTDEEIDRVIEHFDEMDETREEFLEEWEGIDKIAVKDVDVDGNKARVRLTTFFGNGDKDNSTIKMICIDDQWYVDPKDRSLRFDYLSRGDY